MKVSEEEHNKRRVRRVFRYRCVQTHTHTRTQAQAHKHVTLHIKPISMPLYINIWIFTLSIHLNYKSFELYLL